MRSKLGILIVLLVLGIGGYFWFSRSSGPSLAGLGFLQKASSETEIDVEVADNIGEQEVGLSGRDSIPENSGMLFVFETPDYYEFWMEGMLFPLDMIWLDENFKIVAIHDEITPDTYPDESFSPSFPAKYVLEVNAGFAAKNNIKVGATGRFDEAKNKFYFPKEQVSTN